MIFDEKHRNSLRPMDEGEDLYAFYDQSSRVEHGRKRDTINRWASALPHLEAQELRNRMAASSHQFRAAELELTLFEIFRQLGLDIVVHPVTPTGKKVDFGLTSERLSVLVEATTLLESTDEVAIENRLAPVRNALNRVALPAGHNFLVSIESYGDQNPSAKRIVSKVISWVRSVTPVSTTSFPVLLVDDGGWEIELTLINTGTGREYDRSVGGFHGGVRCMSPGADLKQKLQSKARRYGRPDKAFVIAVADFRVIADDPEDVAEALYGQWSTVFNGVTRQTSRRFLPNGFFGHEGNAQNSAVSAVLIMPSEPYWKAQQGDARPVLYLNPFATHKIEPSALPFATVSLDGEGTVLERNGPTLRDLLFPEFRAI